MALAPSSSGLGLRGELRLGNPSLSHPLGTDDLGRDLLARMLYGGRISLAVGLAAMLMAITVGVLIGSLAGMARGWVDAVLMWVTDLFLSLPQLPLLLLLIFLFREPLKQTFGLEIGIFILIVVVIGGFRWMPVARLVRAQFFSLREKEFVEAARALGASTQRQVVRHILPNSLGPVIVAATIDVASPIAIGVAAVFVPESRTAAPDDGFAFGLTYGEVVACLVPIGQVAPTARLRLELCAGATVGLLHAVVFSGTSTDPGQRWTFAAAELTRVIIPIFQGLVVEIALEATQPLPRHAFFVEGRPAGMDTVFTQPVSALVGWAGVGVVWK
jgi:ABC-type methionine transport system permease subunit